jgi:hypothetical protein
VATKHFRNNGIRDLTKGFAMNIKIKRIKKIPDYINYLEKTEHAIGVRFPIEYVLGQKVYGIFSDKKLIGGYSIIESGSLRVVESVKTKGVNPENLKNLSEITGLWIDKKHSKQCSFKLWLHMYKSVLLSKNSKFIFAYSTDKKSLNRLYSQFPTTCLYRGKVEALQGMAGDEYESIEVVAKRDVLKYPFANPGFLLKRSRRFRKILNASKGVNGGGSLVKQSS